MSVIDLAHARDIPVWVDDPVLRAIARHSGLPAFSTPALIDYLAERQTIAISRRETTVRCMIKGRVGDLPLDEGRLLELAEDERWMPGAVAAVIARAAAWAGEHRAIALYRCLLSEAERNGTAPVGQWLYSAVAGAATAANTPAAASRLAAILLAQTIHDLDARGESVAQLLAAARRALYDCDDVDSEAAPDPLPLCSRLLSASASDRVLPHLVARDVLTRFAALPDHDRLAVTQALLE
ncbi:hypothetical protein [Micromonospora sp. NPDC023814]|uniref:hypothetical protein n=1 Tax=Micromonospora sp. NPDC023814 TaxID=3154596 RepID=UPI0033C16BE7